MAHILVEFDMDFNKCSYIWRHHSKNSVKLSSLSTKTLELTLVAAQKRIQIVNLFILHDLKLFKLISDFIGKVMKSPYFLCMSARFETMKKQFNQCSFFAIQNNNKQLIGGLIKNQLNYSNILVIET